jgi:hypothetical protein
MAVDFNKEIFAKVLWHSSCIVSISSVCNRLLIIFSINAQALLYLKRVKHLTLETKLCMHIKIKLINHFVMTRLVTQKHTHTHGLACGVVLQINFKATF